MFIKPSFTNPQIPYNVLVGLSNFAPGYFSTTVYQEIADKYKGFEYFENDTSFLNVYFGHHGSELRLFRVSIDWMQFAVKRKIVIPNIDPIVEEIYDYLWWDRTEKGFEKDLYKAYSVFLTKVFLITLIENYLSDLTKLPCYSDYTWLKKTNAEGAVEFDYDKIYVVYE